MDGNPGPHSPRSHHPVDALPHASCGFRYVCGTRIIKLGESLGACFGLDSAQATPSNRSTGQYAALGSVAGLLRISDGHIPNGSLRDVVYCCLCVFSTTYLRADCPNRPYDTSESADTIPPAIRLFAEPKFLQFIMFQFLLKYDEHCRISLLPTFLAAPSGVSGLPRRTCALARLRYKLTILFRRRRT